MQHGDIVTFKAKGASKDRFGIAYDANLIITGDLWHGIKVISLAEAKLTKQYMINIYRPNVVLNNHKRAHLKRILASMIAKLVPIPWKSRMHFDTVINGIYKSLTKKYPIISSPNLVIVEHFDGEQKNGKTF